MFTQAALRALYSRKMISRSWKLPSTVCVESRFGQASVKKKANTLPNQNTEFDKKSVSKIKTDARKAAWVNMGLKRHSAKYHY